MSNSNYAWPFSLKGKALRSGKAIADTAGLLTIEKLSISDEPRRLTIRR